MAKGNRFWLFIGRTDFEGETPIIWPPDSNKWRIWKDPDAWKDWRQEKKRMTEDEVVGWNHLLDGHEFGYAQGIVDGQGSMACCSPWGRKELDKIQKLNWTKHKCRITYIFTCQYNDAGFTTWYIAFFFHFKKIWKLFFLHKRWNSLHLMHENLGGGSLPLNVDICIFHIWKPWHWRFESSIWR